MSVVTFNSVRFKNLLSYGNNWTEIQLDKCPMTLISGLNGAGKSAMVSESVSVALYGKPFRNAKKKATLINTVNGKGLEVELVVTVNGSVVKIHRGMKPDFLKVYVDGELHPLSDEPDSRNQQKRLDGIIGIPKSTMTQLTLLGSARYGSFMDLEPSERATIIEQVLDISVLSRMSAALTPRITENATAINDAQNKAVKIDSAIAAKEELFRHLSDTTQLDELTDALEEERKAYTAENVHRNSLMAAKPEVVISYDDVPSEVPEDLPPETPDDSIFPALLVVPDEDPTDLPEIVAPVPRDLDKILAEIEETEAKIIAARNKGTEMSAERRAAEKELLFFEHNDTCPTCTQPIDEDFKTGHVTSLTKKVAKINKAVPVMDSVISELNQHVKTLQKIVTECKQEEGQYRVAVAQRDMLIRKHRDERAHIIRTNELSRSSALKEYTANRERMLRDHTSKRESIIRGKELEAKRILGEWKLLVSTSTQKIMALEESIARLENSIKKADNAQKLREIHREIRASQKEKRVVDESLRELYTQRECLNAAKVMFKNNDGIRSYILKQWLPILNAYIADYLDRLGALYGFTLDERFQETILARHRDIMTYNNFSEGEKKRIDMALLLAFRRISSLKSSAATSLLVLDEVMDSSMDDVGTTSLLESFSEINVADNIFVVSHKLTHTEMFERVINVRKAGNFSVIEENV